MVARPDRPVGDARSDRERSLGKAGGAIAQIAVVVELGGRAAAMTTPLRAMRMVARLTLGRDRLGNGGAGRARKKPWP
jgi:hypothetical protein